MQIAREAPCCCSYSCANLGLPVLPERARRTSTSKRKIASPRVRRSLLVTQAFIGAAAPVITAGMGLTISSGLVSLFSFAVGSLGLAYFLSDQFKDEGPNPECSTCEGTGRVSCMCNRWSDGDVGCSICGGSGKMACPSCGGGGTAVPIASRVHIPREPSLMDQQR